MHLLDGIHQFEKDILTNQEEKSLGVAPGSLVRS